MARIGRLLLANTWRALLVAGILLIGAETLLLGGAASSVALTFSGFLALWAAIAFLATPPPAGVVRRPSLMAAATAFGLLILWIALSLAPVPAALAAAPWSRVSAPGAMTMDRAATIGELLKLMTLGCIFAGGVAVGWKRSQARFLLRVLAVAAAFYALWAIASFMIEPEMLLGEVKPYHQDRLTASFASANTAASLFGALAALFAVLATEAAINQLKETPQFGAKILPGPRPVLLLYAVATLLCLGALLLTGSRFGMAATAAGLALGAGLMAVVAGMRPRTAAMIGGGALLFIMALPIISASRATQRLWSTGEAAGDRVKAFGAIVDLALQRPLQGFGLGTFREALTPAMTRDDLWLLWNLGAAHNVAAQWLIETGLVGFGLGVAMIGALMASLSPLPLKRSVPGRGRLIGILAFSAVLLAHNMVDYSLQIASVTALWALLLGLAAGSAFQSEHKGKLAG